MFRFYIYCILFFSFINAMHERSAFQPIQPKILPINIHNNSYSLFSFFAKNISGEQKYTSLVPNSEPHHLKIIVAMACISSGKCPQTEMILTNETTGETAEFTACRIKGSNKISFRTTKNCQNIHMKIDQDNSGLTIHLVP